MGRKVFFWYLILSVLFVSLAPRINAMLVTSSHPLNTAEDLLQIRKVLEEKVVYQRLLDLGFNPGEVRDRISVLTDEQIHDIALQLQQLKVSGAAEGVLIGILVIILVILVVLPLAGIRVWYDGKR